MCCARRRKRQAAWKAKAEPIEKEMKQIRQTQRKLRNMPEAAEQLAKLTKQLEELQEKMPPRRRPCSASGTTRRRRSRSISFCAANTRHKGPPVGMRPLGSAAAGRSAGAAAGHEEAAHRAGQVGHRSGYPLTARVMVNRIWQYHFGRGIVATPNDFGRMGTRPTHPELLDYLANEFVASGFSIKHIHRLILLSSTYRQSSAEPATPPEGSGHREGSGEQAAVAVHPRGVWKPKRSATRCLPLRAS